MLPAAAALFALAAPLVQVGLERLAADGGRPLRGRRVGLVAHAASVTHDGRHAVDVLRASGVDVVRLFAPEHGLRSRAAAGERVGGGTDPDTGLPVVSLYGDKTRPVPEDLRGIDALVVDLQDAGVRFYTYVSTLLLCLDAAAESDLELVVLDRPNPLGGELVEGPLRDPGWPASLVNMAPGPLVHGLTLGEMARYANGLRDRNPARVAVVSMAGWRREMQWAATGRTWTAPSPNLRSAEAALAYPGTCLLEATSLSEGRGTEAPFLLIGAPWLDPARLVAAVSAPGFALEATRFTPAPSEAAVHPKYEGQECAGVRVQVTEPAKARPYVLGLALLTALRGMPGFSWVRDGAALDTLLGTGRIRKALEAGEPPAAIAAADEPELEAFRRARKDALLY